MATGWSGLGERLRRAGLAFGSGPRPAPGETSPAPVTPPLPFEQMLEVSPNPILLVSASDGRDGATRRVIYANGAANALFRIPADGPLLAAVIRQPEALDVVERCLAHGEEAVALFDLGGPPTRSWRAWARPVAGLDDRRLAMLLLRDETDARRNERMRADFLANASHELRTPLASLVGFIETLRGPAKDDEAARERFLGIMAVQAARMARLVEDLLSLSRVEMNEHVRPTEVCDLAFTAADVVAALAPIAQEKDVKVALSGPSAGAAKVVGDRDQLIQVILNLLDNALKYSAPGGQVEVTVGIAPSLREALAADPADYRPGAPEGGRMTLIAPDSETEGGYARLRVQDHGPGIAREHLARLSERFYRVEGQKSGERSGTGLGLAIVKHIVNRHRGGLLVESTPGLGAAFIVALPLASAD